MEFVDLKKQYQLYKQEIDSEINKVLKSAQFIKGPVITELEENLAEYVGVKHAIGCSSGTDALLIALMAKGVGPGDEIIVPDFTFIATAEVISLLGAVPVFIDVEAKSFNLDPNLLSGKITEKTKGIIGVSLFGQCADFDKINDVASQYGLWVIEDAAQSFGAAYKGRKSCNLTEIATTSFFPAKPLGCYGDGGAVFTSSDNLARRMRVILNHGQEERYRHSVIGINGRLDSIQAAVLKVKLKHFDEEVQERQEIAREYTKQLKDCVQVPEIIEGNNSVWAQYTVRHPQRDRIREVLKAEGIPTAVHYPVPLNRQEAFSNLKSRGGKFPVTETLCAEVLSIPMHPFLENDDIKRVTTAIRKAAK